MHAGRRAGVVSGRFGARPLVAVGAWSNQSIAEGWWSVIAANSAGHFASTENNLAAFSADQGQTWINRTLPAGSWQGLCGIGARFIHLGNGNTFTTFSDDNGITWAAGGALPVVANWTTAAAGNGVLIAMAWNSGTGGRSTDNGATWTALTLPGTGYQNVHYGGGKWLAVAAGLTNQGAVSLDEGLTWFAVTMPATAYWAATTYGNGKWAVVAGDSGELQLDSSVVAAGADPAALNGFPTAITARKWTDIEFSNGVFMAVQPYDGTDCATATDPEGVWTMRPMALAADWFAVAAAKNAFVTIGLTLAFSPLAVSNSYGLAPLLTGVTADGAQSYSARSGVTKDGAQTYVSNAGVFAEAAQSYVSRETVLSSGPQSYNSISGVFAESAQTYATIGGVLAESAQTYSAAQGVQAEAAQSYLSFAGVAGELAQGYVAREGVAAESAQSYVSNQGIVADEPQAYEAREGVTSNGAQVYDAFAGVAAEGPQSYAAAADALTVTADMPQSYSSAGYVQNEALQSYIAFGSVTLDAPQGYVAYEEIFAEAAQGYNASEGVTGQSAQAYGASGGVYADGPQSYRAMLTDGYVVSETRAALLYQLALLHGLDPLNPMTTPKNDGQRMAGGVIQTITGSEQLANVTTNQNAVFVGDLNLWIDALAAEIGLSGAVTITPTGLRAGTLALNYSETATDFIVTRAG